MVDPHVAWEGTTPGPGKSDRRPASWPYVNLGYHEPVNVRRLGFRNLVNATNIYSKSTRKILEICSTFFILPTLHQTILDTSLTAGGCGSGGAVRDRAGRSGPGSSQTPKKLHCQHRTEEQSDRAREAMPEKTKDEITPEAPGHCSPHDLITHLASHSYLSVARSK